jgi:hypothetical protein
MLCGADFLSTICWACADEHDQALSREFQLGTILALMGQPAPGGKCPIHDRGEGPLCAYCKPKIYRVTGVAPPSRPPVARAAPLRPLTVLEQIVGGEAAYRAKAKGKINDIPKGYVGEKTCCIMWTAKGETRCSVSGKLARDGVRDVRIACGVELGKETVCAEECLLSTYKLTFVYSAAFDLENGWKPACAKGCRTILAKKNIQDVSANLIRASA